MPLIRRATNPAKPPRDKANAEKDSARKAELEKWARLNETT